MRENTKLADEILATASEIPVECQEHILDLIKAMAFTRRVIENGLPYKKGPEGSAHNINYQPN